jgi:hypothetical protein
MRHHDRDDRLRPFVRGSNSPRATGCRSRPTGSPVQGCPATISTATGTKVDADLSVAQQEALLGWLTATEDELAREDGTEDDAAALRRRLAGGLANLPEAIKKHLERLLELEQRNVETAEGEKRAAQVDRAGEAERLQLEDSLRRLAKTLHGALTHAGGSESGAAVLGEMLRLARRRVRGRRALRTGPESGLGPRAHVRSCRIAGTR